ncbi:hypothetical protein HMI55_006377 [Coelomomyces lativittatus]|nr:hypothetical protein HMI56_004764 [Coelomomyces lativittatus]KAJ1517667.1 hypothetical protein HMI55_006377 [Coelomomyces lativittatus]
MELDPEELFRAFFGPGFSSSFHTARGPHSIRRDRDRGGGGGGGGRFGRGHGHGTHPGTPRNALSWHFLPIVLVMVLSFFHQWNQPPAYPEYTFQPHFQLRYPIITPTYHVKAYVHEPTWMDFQHHYPHEKRTYLKSIEHAFLHQLHSQCKSEKKKKSDDLSRYKGWFWSSSPSDPQRYQEVLSRPLAACEKLKGLGIPPDAPLYFADR